MCLRPHRSEQEGGEEGGEEEGGVKGEKTPALKKKDTFFEKINKINKINACL